MMPLRGPRVRVTLAAAAGGALALYILQSAGFKPIMQATAAITWHGFVVLCLYQFGLFAVLGAAWFVLLPASRGARLSIFIWARMVRDATSDLLPFSHLGGIVLAARTVVARGVPQPLAFGSLATDITAEMLA
jgi:hypothetical protein